MNKYLSEAVTDLELLDLAGKKGIAINSLKKTISKPAAIHNLKKLQMRVINKEVVGYDYIYIGNDVKLISTCVLNDIRMVKTINLLQTQDRESLTSEEIALIYGFLNENLDYVPETLVSCLNYIFSKGIIHTYDMGSNVKIIGKLVRLCYDLESTGHRSLLEKIIPSKKLVDAVISECTWTKKDSSFEDSLKQFYILDEIPGDFDRDKEADRISTFIDILNCAGAIDIYKCAGNYADEVYLPAIKDYSSIAETVSKTVKAISLKVSSDDERDFILQRYFRKATYVKFDLKSLSGYLKNIQTLTEKELENSVITNACFLAVCTGNRYTGLVEQIKEKAEDDCYLNFVIEMIRERKKSFLRLMEENLDLFLQIPYSSVIFDPRFRDLCNMNTLQEKDMRTLLKKNDEVGYLYTKNTMNYRYLNGTYTFQEIITLCKQKDWIRGVYVGLNPDLRVDEKLRRIRQLFHGIDIALSCDLYESASAALSEESFEEYCRRRNITDDSKEAMFQLMVLEKKDPRITALADAAKTGFDVMMIIRNQKPELFKLGLDEFKKEFIHLDTDSKWLLENIEVPEEHMDNFRKFCLEGNASITHDYYKNNQSGNEKQAENVLLIAKAAVYGLLDEVKYMDFQKEISYPVSAEQEESWRQNLELMDGKIKTAEYSDFASCMNIGVKPARTCMHYKDGAYNECLLSTFDANKKIIYVSENGMIIGRAIMRLTKYSDKKKKEVSALQFADVARSAEEDSDEKLVVFLEKCYKNGFSGPKASMIYRNLYELAKKKADLLGAELILANDYDEIAIKNGFFKKQSSIYVSESKNGDQYLDSLGGDCQKGGYYVSGIFYQG